MLQIMMFQIIMELHYLRYEDCRNVIRFYVIDGQGIVSGCFHRNNTLFSFVYKTSFSVGKNIILNIIDY